MKAVGVLRRGRTVLVGAALAAVAPGAAPVEAQEDCQWIAPSGDLDWQGRLARVSTPHLVCRGDVRIRADSARYYEIRNYYELYGNVLYEDTERILRSQRAQYFRSAGRLQAQDDVRLTRRSDNAQVTGENLVHRLSDQADRPDVLTVTGGRPHAVLYLSTDTIRSTDQRTDSARESPSPWEVDGDRIEMEGEERFEASGNVEIVRDSLRGFSDRAVYDSGEGRLTLLSRARMIDAGYTLEGDTIDAALPEDVIREIVSRGRAVLTGEDLDVRAPRIRMLMSEGTLDRLVAVRNDTVFEAPGEEPGEPAQAPPEEALAGAPLPPMTHAALLEAEHPVRPVARARDFVIVADSVDVRLPGEVLERLMAVGNAHGESTARDSLDVEGLPEVARRDWIDGRSIEALFTRAEPPATPEAADTAEAGYRLESLTARGSARSLYRMAPRDTAADAANTAAEDTATGDTTVADPSVAGARRPAIHYVVGDTIVLTLDEGEIRTMDVVGQVRGVHWEPVGRRGGGVSGSSGDGGSSPPRGSRYRRSPPDRRRRTSGPPPGDVEEGA